jgi:hypothetical protein
MKRCDKPAATCSGRVRRLAMYGRLRSGVLGGLAMTLRRVRDLRRPVPVAVALLVLAVLYLLLALGVAVVVAGLWWGMV